MTTVVMPTVAATWNMLRLPIVIEMAPLAEGGKIAEVVVMSVTIEVGNGKDYAHVPIIFQVGKRGQVGFCNGHISKPPVKIEYRYPFFGSVDDDHLIFLWLVPAADEVMIGREAPFAFVAGALADEASQFGPVGRVIFFVHRHGGYVLSVSNLALPDSNSCQIVVPDFVTA